MTSRPGWSPWSEPASSLAFKAAVEDGGDLLGETIDELEPFGDGGGHGSIQVGGGVVRSVAGSVASKRDSPSGVGAFLAPLPAVRAGRKPPSHARRLLSTISPFLPFTLHRRPAIAARHPASLERAKAVR